MKKLLIILFCLLFDLHHAQCQESSDAENLKNPKLLAEQQINNLKDGVLMVRLDTREAQLNSLKRSGNHQAYLQFKEKVDSTNLVIINSFKNLYDFSRVVFFTSDQTLRVQMGFWDGAFVNDSLEIDSSISIEPGTPIFVCDLGPVRLPAFENSTPGIVIMDIELNPLEKPFPFFVKQYKGVPGLERIEPEMIQMMNKRLNDFYKKSNVSKTIIESNYTY